MLNHKVLFDELPWQAALPGARYKVFSDGSKQLRWLELSSEFVEPDWCEKGHIGCVLTGELEIAFDDKLVSYRAGDGIFIAAGRLHRHKARALSASVLLLLVEDI